MATALSLRSLALLCGSALLLLGSGQMADALEKGESILSAIFPSEKYIRATIDIANVATIHSSPIVTGVAWSPDGRTLATYSDYGAQIDIWRDNGDHVVGWRRTGLDIPYPYSSIGFLDNQILLTPPDGRTELSADSAVSFWDLQKGVVDRNVTGPAPGHGWRANVAQNFTLNTDRSVLAILTRGWPSLVTVYSSPGWTVEFMPPSRDFGSASSIAVSSDGKLLAVGNPSGHVVVYDIKAKRLIQDIAAFVSPATPVSTISFSPDGKELVAAVGIAVGGVTVSTPLRTWRIVDGSAGGTFPDVGLQPIRDVRWSPRGDYIAFATDKGARLWRMKDNSSITLETASSMALAFAPSGDMLAVGNASRVTIFDMLGYLDR